jgi:hypothetical protein
MAAFHSDRLGQVLRRLLRWLKEDTRASLPAICFRDLRYKAAP